MVEKPNKVISIIAKIGRGHICLRETRSHMPERDEMTYALREIDLRLNKSHYIGTVIFNQIYVINHVNVEVLTT